jgi:hypothetical protein
MRDRDAQGRRIVERVRAALLKHWDPIGIRREEGLEDEYNRYVGGVYRLLASGATAQQRAEHLSRVESEWMGFSTPASKLLPVARELLSLNVRLKRGSVA